MDPRGLTQGYAIKGGSGGNIIGSALGAAVVYPSSATDGPRPLNVTQRVEGLTSGIEQLAYNLECLAGKIHGHGDTANAKQAQPIGIVSMLSDAESALRRCHEILSALHDTF